MFETAFIDKVKVIFLFNSYGLVDGVLVNYIWSAFDLSFWYNTILTFFLIQSK